MNHLDINNLVHRLVYAAYSWGFEAGKVGRHVDTTIAAEKAGAALKNLLDAVGAMAAPIENGDETDPICSSCNGTGDAGISRGPGMAPRCDACKGTGVEP